MTSVRAVLFPPPDEPVSLVVGRVMHARMKPVAHRFAYDVFALLVDLDRLSEASRRSRLFGVNAVAPVSFHERDHGPCDGTSLRRYVDRVLEPEGIDLEGGRVLLQCYPRVFGTVFNPLSVYFAYRRGGDLAAVVYEVRNTFGQRHSYVAPVRDGELSAAGLRQERDKLFYVSPFNGLEMRYHFRLRPPTGDFAMRILETDSEGPLLAATFSGVVKPLTTRGLVSALVDVPLLTLKVIAGIHWEALKLWIKGMRLVDRPPAPPALSYGPTAGTSLSGGSVSSASVDAGRTAA